MSENDEMKELADMFIEIQEIKQLLKSKLKEFPEESGIKTGRTEMIKTTEETTKLFSEEEIKTGFKDWNTRILEILDKEGFPKLIVGTAYCEWYRIGDIHAEWTRDTVERLVDYLQNWLERTKNEPCKKSTETSKKLYKELQKIGK